MKTIFKFFLKYYLKYITKLVLYIHHPLIIGVTGSINVPFVKDEIMRQLVSLNTEIRSNPKNFNTEIGLPLAILNLPSGYNSYKNWIPIIWQALKSIFNPRFPEILVLALGVSRPGDMKYLMTLIRPKIAVITDITQRYLESFDDMDELIGEYEILAESISQDGYLILNNDNSRIKNINAEAKTIYFGTGKAPDDSRNYWRGELIEKSNSGQKISVSNNEESADYEINRFGLHHAYALLAGLIVKHVILNT